MSGIDMSQGELRIGKVIHKAALNCLIVPRENPEEWFFKQFLSTEEVEQYAAEHDLTITKEDLE